MSRMGRRLAWLLAACLLGGTPALAADEDEEPDYARPGAYIKGAAQVAIWNAHEGMAPAAPASWQPDFAFDIWSYRKVDPRR